MTVAEKLRSLYPRLIADEGGIAEMFDAQATVDTPAGGRQEPEGFLAETRGWLARHAATSSEVHTVVTPGRVVHELELELDSGGARVQVPVMLVADVAGGIVRNLRIYHSTWPLTGRHVVRHPLMPYTLTERPPEPVGTYHEALGRGDADAADGVFEADGMVREPAGGRWVYRGPERTSWYRAVLSQGPIVLHLGTITDDGETVVYEYMADRWGKDAMPPQAGAAAYQRGLSGKLCAARIYDDVEPPASLSQA